jgi:hypothetical protein
MTRAEHFTPNATPTTATSNQTRDQTHPRVCSQAAPEAFRKLHLLWSSPPPRYKAKARARTTRRNTLPSSAHQPNHNQQTALSSEIKARLHSKQTHHGQPRLAVRRGRLRRRRTAPGRRAGRQPFVAGGPHRGRRADDRRAGTRGGSRHRRRKGAAAAADARRRAPARR